MELDKREVLTRGLCEPWHKEVPFRNRKGHWCECGANYQNRINLTTHIRESLERQVRHFESPEDLEAVMDKIVRPKMTSFMRWAEDYFTMRDWLMQKPLAMQESIGAWAMEEAEKEAASPLE